MIRQEINRQNVMVAAVSAAGMALSIGPVVYSTFSQFMLSMAGNFAWGRGQFSSAVAFSFGASALVVPWVGRLVDRYGARAVLLCGLLGFAATNALLAAIDGSLILFYILFAGVGASAAFCGAVPYARVLARGFQSNRGLAIGLVLGGGAGLGAALTPHLVRFVDVHFGWRIARLVLSACVVLVSLPLVRYVLRSEDSPALRVRARPATDVVLLGAVEIELVGVRAGIARRQLTFWMLVVMLLVGTASLAGTAIHLIALFTDKGMNMTTATLIYSAYSLTNVLGHALSGLLLDRINSPRVGIFGYLSGLVSLVLLYSTNSLPGLAVAAVLLGLAFGAEVSLAAYWVARYWGLRSYAEIYGSLYAAVSAGAAVGPWLMGAAFERHGSYHSALGLFILCLACCGVLTWLLRPYRYPIDLESAAI